jgi:hypothetical protein
MISLSSSYPSINACLHSRIPHGTSLTIISPLQSIINRHNTHIPYILPYRYHLSTAETDRIDVSTFGGGRSITQKYFRGRIVNYYARNDPLVMLDRRAGKLMKLAPPLVVSGSSISSSSNDGGAGACAGAGAGAGAATNSSQHTTASSTCSVILLFFLSSLVVMSLSVSLSLLPIYCSLRAFSNTT